MEEYQATALRLAADLPRLFWLRQTLRQQLLGSVLCDSVAATARLEQLYRQIWHRWCSEQE